MNQQIIPPRRPAYESPLTVLIDAHPDAKVINIDPRAFAMSKDEIAREISGVIRQWVKENAA